MYSFDQWKRKKERNQLGGGGYTNYVNTSAGGQVLSAPSVIAPNSVIDNVPNSVIDNNAYTKYVIEPQKLRDAPGTAINKTISFDENGRPLNISLVDVADPEKGGYEEFVEGESGSVGTEGGASAGNGEPVSNGTENTPGIGKTYEEYAKDSEYLKYVAGLAKENKTEAIRDADTSYQKALSGYGRNAELLAKMGLTGSGYSDYLDAQAYAQKQNAISEANATYDKTLKDAKYQDYVNYEAKQDEYRTVYDTYSTRVQQGNYSEDEVRAMLKNSGLNASDVNSIVELSKATKNTNIESLSDELLSMIYTDGLGTEAVNNLLNLERYKDLIGTDYEQVIKDAATKNTTDTQNKNSDVITSDIYSGNYDYTAAGGKALEIDLNGSGLTDTEQIKNKYLTRAVTSVLQDITNGVFDETSSEEFENYVLDNPMFGESERTKIKSAYICKDLLDDIKNNAHGDSVNVYIDCEKAKSDMTEDDWEKIENAFLESENLDSWDKSGVVMHKINTLVTLVPNLYNISNSSLLAKINVVLDEHYFEDDFSAYSDFLDFIKNNKDPAKIAQYLRDYNEKNESEAFNEKLKEYNYSDDFYQGIYYPDALLREFLAQLMDDVAREMLRGKNKYGGPSE